MLTLTIRDTWNDGKRTHVCGTLAATGTYAAGGDGIAAIPDIANPEHIEAQLDNGFSAVPVYGASLSASRLKLIDPGGSELTPGGYANRGDQFAGPLDFYGIFDTR